MIEKLIQEIKETIVTPNQVFARLKNDERSITEITRDFLAYLAAIPAVAGFFGLVVVGQRNGLAQYLHAPLFSGLMWAVVLFVLSIAGIYLISFLVTQLAPQFNSMPDETAAFKLVVYSFVPIFALGIFGLLPSLFGLYILGLYGIYLFYIGCQIMLECPEDKALSFTVVVSLAGILITVLLHRIAASVIA